MNLDVIFHVKGSNKILKFHKIPQLFQKSALPDRRKHPPKCKNKQLISHKNCLFLHFCQNKPLPIPLIFTFSCKYSFSLNTIQRTRDNVCYFLESSGKSTVIASEIMSRTLIGGKMSILKGVPSVLQCIMPRATPTVCTASCSKKSFEITSEEPLINAFQLVSSTANSQDTVRTRNFSLSD